jgi:hypothetical protein
LIEVEPSLRGHFMKQIACERRTFRGHAPPVQAICGRRVGPGEVASPVSLRDKVNIRIPAR